MNFTIESDIFDMFPHLHVGLLVIKDVDNTKPSDEITHMLRKAEEHVRNEMEVETFKEHPHIAALQEAHRTYGNNPNKYPPSVQALCKRILKGGQLPSINPLVDIYNIVSLNNIICAGCEDLDVVEGDIRLAFAEGSEPFRALGEEENTPPDKGEIVYKDDAGVICRKFNWREGDRTKLTEHTNNAVLVIEGLPPVSVELLENALNDLEELVVSYCGGFTEQHLLHRDNQSASL